MFPNDEMDAPDPQNGCGHQAPCDYTVVGCAGGDDGGFPSGAVGSGLFFGGTGILGFIGGGDPGLLPPDDPFDMLLGFGPMGPCSFDPDGSLAAADACAGGAPSGAGGGGGLFPRARQLVQTVLDTKNDCSKFFNSMLLPSMSGDFGVPMTAGDFFRTDNIAYSYGMPGQPQLPPGSVAAAMGGAGAGATIWIAPNGPFDLKAPNTTIGGYAGGYPEAQAEIIFHELAHTLLGIPSDSKDPLQSWANQQTIDDNCYSAILAQIRGK